jgi:hypothetical protein
LGLIDTTTLENGQFIFHQIIRKSGYDGDSTILLDPLYTTNYPYEKGLPTFKYEFRTNTGKKTREYLPIRTNPTILKYLGTNPGTTWIPVQLANHEQEIIHTLEITNAPKFENIEFQFNWEEKIQPGQLAIPRELNIQPSRKRKWSIALGQSYLMSSKTEENTQVTNLVMLDPKPRQLYTVTVPEWYVQENQHLATILKRGEKTPLREPDWGNIYLRFRKGKLNHYYVFCENPSHNGLTFEHGDNTIYFHRISPLTGQKYRFIHKKLSKFTGASDWIPLSLDEIMFLSIIMPPKIHAKLLERIL